MGSDFILEMVNLCVLYDRTDINRF